MIRKAVIPAVFPSRNIVPFFRGFSPALLPVISNDGRVLPVIQLLVEDLLESGIREIAIITSPSRKWRFEKHFNPDFSLFPEGKIQRDPRLRTEINRLKELSSHITVMTQERAPGIGDAVLAARDWVSGEPFLMVPGHFRFVSYNEIPVFRQLIQQRVPESHSLAIECSPIRKNPKDGYVTLVRTPDEHLKVSDIQYGVTPDFARKELPGFCRQKDSFPRITGPIIFEPIVFDIIDRMIEKNIVLDGKIELFSIWEILYRLDTLFAVEVKGSGMEIQDAETYITYFSVTC